MEKLMLEAETINRILRFHGNGLPVVSLYAPVDAGAARRELHARVSSLLAQIHPLAKDSALTHEARMSVRADMERIREALGVQHWQPGAIAIFSCSGRDLYEEVPLPRRVREQIVVDATAFSRPMLAVLDEYHRSCVAVIDKASVRVWEMYQDEMREVTNVRDRVLRKPNYAAGLAEDRVRNKADELSKRHYRRVAELLDELLRADGYDLLIIGGHDYELPEVASFLPRELRARMAGTFSIDPATAPLAEIRSKAGSILESYEREEEQRLVSEVLEKAAMGGLATVGLDNCLWAGTLAAIQTLVVEEGATAPGVVCDRSGWLALSGDICPLCGNATRHTPDVIDELVEAVIYEGGSIKHVAADTKLSAYHAAAELRFPLPPVPSASP
jgi:peptide subunit release factor 1 (eRF1)